jgi:uncharacterized protein YpiB (UPF0302 family)
MKEADWISFLNVNDKTYGYILQTFENGALKIQSVYYLRNNKVVMSSNVFVIGESNCCLQPNITHPDDISSLIDLALKTRDKKWFDELTAELSQWEPVKHCK